MNNKRRKIKSKLSSRQGASLAVALLVFLLCAMAGSVVLAAASGAAGTMSTLEQDGQAKYTLTSIGNVMADKIVDTKYEYSTEAGKGTAIYEGTDTSRGDFAAVVGKLADKINEQYVADSGSIRTATSNMTVKLDTKNVATVHIAMDPQYNITVTLKANNAKDSDIKGKLTITGSPFVDDGRATYPAESVRWTTSNLELTQS